MGRSLSHGEVSLSYTDSLARSLALALALPVSPSLSAALAYSKPHTRVRVGTHCRAKASSSACARASSTCCCMDLSQQYQALPSSLGSTGTFAGLGFRNLSHCHRMRLCAHGMGVGRFGITPAMFCDGFCSTVPGA
jgi:hypothetical protein